MQRVFRDRFAAGGALASGLTELELDAPLVLGLARGGVPVAAAVARSLAVEFDVFVSCKIGLPGREELGIGAVAEGLDQPVFSHLAVEFGVGDRVLWDLAELARAEVARRVRLYRGGRALPQIFGNDVLLVDDGLATGVSAEAGVRALRQHGPRRLVLAAPVCAPDSARHLTLLADDVICGVAPRELLSVGDWYDDFSQTTDREVLDLLASPGGRGRVV